MAKLNPTLVEMGAYASKAISQLARANPAILNLSIGEPAFGPPAHLLEAIAAEDLTLSSFLDSAKRYEHTLGAPRLRHAIAAWYQRRYGLTVDPEREILITHGGVEAIALALLACTAPGQRVAVTNPSYMLYQRAILALGRTPVSFARPVADEEFLALIEADPAFRAGLGGASALIVNSPENPSGYVLSEREWQRLVELSERNDAWLIHDEVYDAMTFARPHFPARSVEQLGERTILANSFSKKFGVPGLRIGWMVASPRVIEMAGKAHDYLVLGVNRQYEQIAARLLEDDQVDQWLLTQRDMVARRARQAMTALDAACGFDWPRQPMGGMFLFPSVRRLHQALPASLREAHPSAGEAVAHYLLQTHEVATVPGVIYGSGVADHLRMVLCTDERSFNGALERLAHAGQTLLGGA